jgi:hypothetical protein
VEPELLVGALVASSRDITLLTVDEMEFFFFECVSEDPFNFNLPPTTIGFLDATGALDMTILQQIWVNLLFSIQNLLESRLRAKKAAQRANLLKQMFHHPTKAEKSVVVYFLNSRT